MTAKRIMRVFKINEISMVDEPAQSPAVVSIMKRRDTNVIRQNAVAIKQFLSNGSNTVKKQEPGMTPEEKIAALEEQLKAAMEELASYKAAAAAAATKEEAPPFDEEAMKAKKAKSEIAYTSTDGTVFTKADDPRLVKMARETDEYRKALAEQIIKGKRLEFAKRAQSELAHLPGEEVHKVSLLEVIDAIADEPTRAGITKMLHANDAGLAEAMKRRGTTGGVAEGSTDVNKKLEVMAKAWQTEKGVTFAKAFDQVLNSPEGKALYAQLKTSSNAPQA